MRVTDLRTGMPLKGVRFTASLCEYSPPGIVGDAERKLRAALRLSNDQPPAAARPQRRLNAAQNPEEEPEPIPVNAPPIVADAIKRANAEKMRRSSRS